MLKKSNSFFFALKSLSKSGKRNRKIMKHEKKNHKMKNWKKRKNQKKKNWKKSQRKKNPENCNFKSREKLPKIWENFTKINESGKSCICKNMNFLTKESFT